MIQNEEIVCKVVKSFRELESGLTGDEHTKWTNTMWTQEVLTTLCKSGKDLSFTTWASGKVPKEFRNGGEWLYDVTWCKHASDEMLESIPVESIPLESIPLVAECEWGNIELIQEDFEKLLVARARVRVMVCDSESARLPGGTTAVVEKIREWVGAFHGDPGDTYLIVVYGENRRFRYYKILANEDRGQLPTVQKLS